MHLLIADTADEQLDVQAAENQIPLVVEFLSDPENLKPLSPAVQAALC